MLSLQERERERVRHKTCELYVPRLLQQPTQRPRVSQYLTLYIDRTFSNEREVRSFVLMFLSVPKFVFIGKRVAVKEETPLVLRQLAIEYVAVSLGGMLC